MPVTFALFYLLRRSHYSHAITFLILASLFFYGWWEISFLPILLGSIAVNFSIGKCMKPEKSKALLWVGGIFNLGLLGYFKYTGFFMGIFTGEQTGLFGFAQAALPLGISFFTFQQIAYLVDRYKNKTQAHGLREYMLFVCFFPQLIAGPIVHQQEMLPQFAKDYPKSDLSENVAIGLSIFVIGLFKKLVLADMMAGYATPVFNAAESGQDIEFLAAWIGAICYTFQIYFDFSGYSDMAIGLARLFGIKLPQNFYSPYKALNIVEFWRRWHITLSRFLRDYLYIPLGGNRKGNVRRYANLMTTMLLGGFWHGAGWTFIIWGGLHGAYLCINHGWQHVTRGKILTQNALYKLAAMGLTFFAVVIAWVFFRALSLESAFKILSGMAGLNGFAYGGNPFYQGKEQLLSIALMFVIAFLLPNTQTYMASADPVFQDKSSPQVQLSRYAIFQWKQGLLHAAFIAALFAICVMHMDRIHEFIYFQF